MLGMSIRFQCGACSQPIEVDDEWALRAVACPYCRKTITAPSESTLGDLSRIPMASPLMAVGSAVALPAPAPSSYAPPDSNANPLAVAAFILAAAMVILLLSGAMIAAPHALELEQLQKELQPQPGVESGSQVRAVMEYLNTHGGNFPVWLVAVGVLQISAMAACAAAIVCGLLALRRRARRPLAVIALVSSGCVVLLFCLSFAAAFAGVGLHR
jgi:DNA-directed RNA polymerase subunit RPC12/RpoP